MERRQNFHYFQISLTTKSQKFQKSQKIVQIKIFSFPVTLKKVSEKLLQKKFIEKKLLQKKFIEKKLLQKKFIEKRADSQKTTIRPGNFKDFG
jgi:BarA-like signal transduction histidine kinase